MKVTLGTLYGIVVSIVMFTLWIVGCWLWDAIGVEIIKTIAIVNGKRSLGLFELTKPFLGGLIYYSVMTATIEVYTFAKVSLRAYVLAASIVSGFVVLVFSAGSYLYSDSSVSSFWTATYGIAMLALPSIGIFLPARKALRFA